MSKALNEASNSISPSKIRSIYGDLATPELITLVQDVLRGVTEKSLAEFESILEAHQVNAKMVRLEELVQEAAQDESDLLLKERASNFAELLPEGVTPADVLRMSAHEMKLAEKDRLLAELERLTAENTKAEEEIERGKEEIGEELERIEEERKRFQRTADVCSMAN